MAKCVTAISSVRGAHGGRHVEDKFEVISTELVESLVGHFNRTHGHGALVLRQNSTAVMLVPPLEFRFKTKRESEETLGSLTELIISGHFMCLVDRVGPQGPRWAFDDLRTAYADDIPPTGGA